MIGNARRVALGIISGKIFLFRGSETPVGVSEPHFHGWIVEDDPLSLLTAFAASSPKGTPFCNTRNFPTTAKAVPLGKVA